MLLDVVASACKPSKKSPATAPAKAGVEMEKQGLLSEGEGTS